MHLQCRKRQHRPKPSSLLGTLKHSTTSIIEYNLADPALSPLGREQCASLQNNLRRHLPEASTVQLIITSPMRRTLETTQLSLTWLIDKGIPVMPRAEWQENSAKPCDTGTDITAISQEFPSINFSDVDPAYPCKTGLYAYSKDSVLNRGRFALETLADAPEKVIAVVSHSAFMRTSVANARFANADYRVFDLSRTRNGVELKQWKSTEEMGGGMSKSQRGRMGIEPGDFPYSPMPKA